MKAAKSLSFIGMVAMTAVLVFGFTQGSFFEDGGALLKNPWGVVSFVDLYVGFTLFSMWIAFREKNILLMAAWILAMMILGFFAGALYVFIHLVKSKGDMLLFFLGDRKKEVLRKERKAGRRSEEDEWKK
ncbi:DUF1475 family protein [Proteiniclasticum sp. C24MP]|uniref:DUF1475 family protein n=1 Tax=Proteiniclasticum sp. C24MP TaxID=3374101 RepID=UPI0037543699